MYVCMPLTHSFHILFKLQTAAADTFQNRGWGWGCPAGA